jgi:hypothetical protein
MKGLYYSNTLSPTIWTVNRTDNTSIFWLQYLIEADSWNNKRQKEGHD